MITKVYRSHNEIIGEINPDRRCVWVLDPISGDVVEFLDEHRKMVRGRMTWVSRREEVWSNPKFAGHHPWGLMPECPPVPALTEEQTA